MLHGFLIHIWLFVSPTALKFFWMHKGAGCCYENEILYDIK
uniref:Uncharacterized protein n=1 Tax=Setaria viridis TaxID=4556 RepID=A0A4U6TII6_SETVI|nr:hypothetical protein SEVIR_8G131450v2 [Setaria viridis]